MVANAFTVQSPEIVNMIGLVASVIVAVRHAQPITHKIIIGTGVYVLNAIPEETKTMIGMAACVDGVRRDEIKIMIGKM